MGKYHAEKIIITYDEKTVTARMGDITATAVCSEEDTFDLSVGTKIAVDRLMFEFENRGNVFKVGDIVTVGKTGYDCVGEYDADIQGKIIGFNKGINEKYRISMVTGKVINAAECECYLVMEGSKK